MVIHLAMCHRASTSASDRVVYGPVATGDGGGDDGAVALRFLCVPPTAGLSVAMKRC